MRQEKTNTVTTILTNIDGANLDALLFVRSLWTVADFVGYQV
jgi:hypothetical protein